VRGERIEGRKEGRKGRLIRKGRKEAFQSHESHGLQWWVYLWVLSLQ
jgi:hypothetical protein